MKINTRSLIVHASIGAAALVFGLPSYAQQSENDESVIEEIIVTGTSRPTTKFESTMSVTALPAEDVQRFAPRSTAEIFRTIPGIQSESTGGDANANIKIRGLPISEGGARYLSIQEDGLPALIIGDFAFATADSFIRFDQSVQSVQSIRGGSASTQASNSPGGIINFISKTGEEKGGSIGFTTGLEYDANRLDFSYGQPLDGGWRFFVAGYLRSGEGVRDAVDKFEQGGQLKANLTKEFDNGFVRFNAKILKDNVPTYLPIPARFTGNNSYEEVGVSFGDGTLLLNDTNYNVRRGGAQASDLSDGFEASVSSFGVQLEFDLSDVFSVSNNFRVASIDGNFASPFPANVFDIASGPATELVVFDTQLDDFGNTLNDLKLTADFESVQITLGLFYADQEEKMQWSFNQYYRQLDANRTPFDQGDSVGGVLYSNPAFGNCCQREYDFNIENLAPSLTFSGDIGDSVGWDVSYRRDDYSVSGTFAESAVQVPLDINGDGTIGQNEQEVNTFGASLPANYDASFDSYSGGINWALNDTTALFFNASQGGSLTAPDRTTGNILASGNIRGEEFALNEVRQQELGVKYRGDNASIYVTLFNAETEEAPQFGVTTQLTTQNDFESKGLEIEADYVFSDEFSIDGSVTFTDSEIVASSDAATIGNTPRRQADYIFNVTPQYSTDKWTLGATIAGTDEVFVQNVNQAKFDAYTTVNAFFSYYFSDSLSVSLNANNLFDEEGFSEGEEGAPSAGDFVRIRPINGRTTSLTLRYDLF